MPSETLSPSEAMNATYKSKVAKFPEKLNRVQTNNLVAFMTQRLPMKASENHVYQQIFLFR